MTNAANAYYDPLAVGMTHVTVVDLNVHDDTRNRDIPLRVTLPSVRAPQPVILYSHGLGGANTNNPYLSQHWAGRGYVAVFMQHHGSDEALWKGKPMAERVLAMKSAANKQNAIARVQDAHVVLNALQQYNDTEGNILYHRLDIDHIAMSGHSFGAVTTQAVSGQVLPSYPVPTVDMRIKAAVPMSPSLPRGLLHPEATFAGVTIPWLLMTGTDDNSPIGNVTASDRAKVFAALPKNDKYQLVLYHAEHSAFGDRPLPGEHYPRNPEHHKVILALSTAFFDAYLRNDRHAKSWLASDAPRAIMQEGDSWQWK